MYIYHTISDLSDSKYVSSRLNGTWLARETPIEITADKPLELLSKTVLDDAQTVRLEFQILHLRRGCIAGDSNIELQVGGSCLISKGIPFKLYVVLFF